MTWVVQLNGTTAANSPQPVVIDGDLTVEGGALVFRDRERRIACAYGPATWRSVEPKGKS